MLFFATRARLFKNTRFQDPTVKRMLSKLQNIGKAALPKDKLLEVTSGAPGSPGTCSSLWGGGQPAGGEPRAWGGREVGGAGPELPLGEEQSKGCWEDATARTASPG